MSIFNRGKKILSLIVIVSFCFLIFQAAPMSANSSNSKKEIKKSDVGVIEQQADWDQPVKKRKKKSILPWILGGLVVVGGVVLLVVLMGKSEDPRGQWNVTMNMGPGYTPQIFTFVMNIDGSSDASGTWNLAPKFIDRGTWTRDGDQVTIRANYGTDFVLLGTIKGDNMDGRFDWPGLNINDREWSAVRIGDPVENKVKMVGAGKSLKDAVK